MKDNIRIEPRWDKTKEEIWNDHFEKMTASAPQKAISARRGTFSVRNFYYAAVAAVILLLLVPLVYTRDVVAKRGEHVTYRLPDGSVASLNAQSEISYRPLLWLIDRRVRMDGEAYFSVEKGSRFTVKSNNGSVTVLGTKFNVKSRGAVFEVACLTGKVSIKAGLNRDSKDEIVIEGGEGVSFSGKNTVRKISGEANENSASWMEYTFVFTDTPLRQVIDEISRQYDIDIAYNDTEEYLYTGKFSREVPVGQVLEIVTLPFSLKITKEESGYKIIK